MPSDRTITVRVDNDENLGNGDAVVVVPIKKRGGKLRAHRGAIVLGTGFDGFDDLIRQILSAARHGAHTTNIVATKAEKLAELDAAEYQIFTRSATIE